MLKLEGKKFSSRLSGSSKCYKIFGLIFGLDHGLLRNSYRKSWIATSGQKPVQEVLLHLLEPLNRLENIFPSRFIIFIS